MDGKIDENHGVLNILLRLYLERTVHIINWFIFGKFRIKRRVKGNFYYIY